MRHCILSSHARHSLHQPSVRSCLSLGLVRRWKLLHVVLQVPFVGQELDVRTILQQLARLPQLDVLIALQWCESPVLADNDLLATGELVHGSP